jgi:argininosuccinate synthase
MWFSPLKRALDAFIAQASVPVTGDVRMRLDGGRAVATGRRSESSLSDYDLATYDTGDTFDQSLAKGFVELWGLPGKIAAIRDRRILTRRSRCATGYLRRCPRAHRLREAASPPLQGATKLKR